MALNDNSERTSRRQQVRTAESTRRLLDAAIELIAEKGFERTTAIEIGERAGYSRSMVRFRYGSKEALLESLLRNEYEPLLLAAAPEGLDGLHRALAALSRILSAAETQPALLRAFFTVCFEAVGPIEHLRPWLSDWLKRFETEVCSALREGIEDGSVGAHVDPELEGRRSIDFGLGLGFRWVLEPTRDFVEEWTDYIERAAAEWRRP